MARVLPSAVPSEPVAPVRRRQTMPGREKSVVYLRDVRPHQLREAVVQGWPLLLPAGCLEYHRQYLPLGVDTLTAQEAYRRVAERLGAAIAPSLEYGYTGYTALGPNEARQNGVADIR